MNSVDLSRGIERKFFIFGTGLPMRPEDYHIGFACEQNPPNGRVHYRPDIAPFGPVINVGAKTVAFGGCTVLDNLVECVQIQGARGAYKELTPLRWDEALLNAAVDLFQGREFDALLVPPAQNVPGCDDRRYLRLRKRYDQAAMKQGFRFSQELNRYVYELK